MSVQPDAVIRAFIAIELSEPVRRRLADCQQTLKRQTLAKVRWVAPGNIHLTLAFLGDIFGAKVDPIAAGLREIAAAVAPFEFEIEGLGFFGSPRNPRVIWAGVTGGRAPLAALQAQVAAMLVKVGLPPERRAFNPHLTLGRVKSVKGADQFMPTLEAMKPTDFGRVGADHVRLIRSVLAPTGAQYSVLADAPLAGQTAAPAT
ncbi:MAG: RNA 2',3'-cyclic phosphodiesterase [Kiritimatiellae bacterium]|nr:RNA 2',3'-cyclic phosphodiesterase [Kiritimatiellia bacterium]